MDSHSEPSTVTGSHRRVLFICTGNYYRSRFAEAVFNHHAEERKIPWIAFSRGLAVHLAEGHLSTFTIEALKLRQIELRHTDSGRIQLSAEDFLIADYRIALDHSEHFKMMLNQFPSWADQIDYWDVPDIPFRSSLNALPEIELKVMQLLEKLAK